MIQLASKYLTISKDSHKRMMFFEEHGGINEYALKKQSSSFQLIGSLFLPGE
jgi:hypothetical protein